MARINIEDCWWIDPRRSKLIRLLGGDEDRADGAAVRMWRLAQENWKHARRLVPRALFESLEHASSLLGAGLAELRGDEVYIRGSNQYLDWVREKNESARINGSKGGKVSARRGRDATGKLLPKTESAKQTPSESQAKSSESKLSVSGSSSGSSSDSDSFSGSEISKEPASPNAGAFIGTYCRFWKERYGSRPEITGKERGIAKRLAKDVGTERLCNLVESFLRMNTQWFLTKRHDLATFEQNLNAVVQFHDTGTQITQSQARAAENVEHAQDQLRRIAAGTL